MTGEGHVPRPSVCVHGHFYQPPREDPWLGAIEPQASAAPYHDWNERITAECYRPNSAARILDESGRELAAVNNYSRISFDFGPTLLTWIEQFAPDVYAAVLAADKVAHGAMAQAYNHIILPLANARDRATQVIWGGRDFAHRFGREPEGMWLPETAVDTASLEELAAAGIQFTVLAPRQARRVRRFGTSRWQDVSGGRVDPHFAYQVRLPSERHIAVFFYDAGLSQAVAFEGLLNDGHAFAGRLASAFDARRREPQLVSIATDGESYGHHHRFGEMALAAALRCLDQSAEASVTNYRAFLAKHPPAREVEIFENTSWSCIHGIERWRADCGCNSGGFPAWRQAWRAPLRSALDWLRDQLAHAFQQAALKLLWNPWAARNDYIGILLDRSPAAADSFLRHHARRALSEPERTQIWNLMEMQRMAMFMFTSCGWFFDDISGLEASQILAYAARAVELAADCLGLDLEQGLLRRLALAHGNVPQFPDGRAVYLEQLRRRPEAAAEVR
jgi:alpha-amylase/alpha-mannosidase (GH57 family)